MADRPGWLRCGRRQAPTSVIVVDDHAGFRAMARMVLTTGGFDVVGEARSGCEALLIVPELHPDVVLLDVQLPDADGFAICAALREAGASRRIVLCSVRPAEDYGTRIGACGADGYLSKDRLTGPGLRALL